MRRPSDRLPAALACAVVLLCAAAPVSNPDLFWHLSAARRMLLIRAIPSFDWLSSTLSGSPWIDFEWLSQIVYGALNHFFGMAGLWGLKVLLILAGGGAAWKTMELYRLPASRRALAISLWAVSCLPRSDLRPEWFSTVSFALLFWKLEENRLTGRILRPIWAFFLFALWANLHAGFAFGIALVGVYAGGDVVRALGRLGGAAPQGSGLASTLKFFWAALAGTFVQPFGLSLYGVLWSHWKDIPDIENYIYEWRPLSLDNPWHWPVFLMMALSAGLVSRRLLRRGRIPMEAALVLTGTALVASRHARMTAYFVAVAVPFIGCLGQEKVSKSHSEPEWEHWLAFILILACLALAVPHAKMTGTLRKIYDDRYVPSVAAEFLKREAPVLSHLRFYNDQWGWGGYLGYRLYPSYLVFQDGRYIFHRFLAEVREAVSSPRSWDRLMERHRVDLALMENMPRWTPSTRIYPDRSSKEFQRPYYISFMPRDKWALVHWDDQALLFVRRGSVSREWLAGHEYRFDLPHDEAARSDASGRGEIDLRTLQSERTRHASEMRALEPAALSAIR